MKTFKQYLYENNLKEDAKSELAKRSDHQRHADNHEDRAWRHEDLRDEHEDDGKRSRATKHDMAADYHNEAHEAHSHAHAMVQKHGPDHPKAKSASAAAHKATKVAYDHEKKHKLDY
jgi:hypothetical protein